MPKEITRREALSVIKARLYQVFDDNIKSLKIIKDKIKRDYDNFLDLQKYENYAEDEVKALNDLSLNKIYSSIDFTKKQKEKLKTDLSLKQCFRKYYFGTAPQRCCFCGQLLEKIEKSIDEDYNISTIEHIFPKDKFPQYALYVSTIGHLAVQNVTAL